MIGDLGENLASVFLSQKTPQGHLFRTALVGEKRPTIDIYAELIPQLASCMFCFFQIKTTEQGYNKSNGNLKVGVKRDDLNKLANYNAPSYLIGINYNSAEPFRSEAYMVTVRGNYQNGLSSLPTIHPLTDQNLISLKDEVVNFWIAANVLPAKENFISNF